MLMPFRLKNELIKKSESASVIMILSLDLGLNYRATFQPAIFERKYKHLYKYILDTFLLLISKRK